MKEMMAGIDELLEHGDPWTADDVRKYIRILNTVVGQIGAIRVPHFYADFALSMFAHHVSEYANAVLLVLDSEVPGTAYPLVRAAFEAQLDVLYLATSGESYDLNGARAYVAARLADYEAFGAHKRAARVLNQEWGDIALGPLRESLRNDAEKWEVATSGKGQLIMSALDLVLESRKTGRKHWTGHSREALHKAVEAQLQEKDAAVLFQSLYSHMANRSHSGLRLGPYVSNTDAGIRVHSKPDPADPSPLQRIGDILKTTVLALVRSPVTQKGSF